MNIGNDKQKDRINDFDQLQNAKHNTDWLDWHWQLGNRISGPRDLSELLGINEKQEEEIRRVVEVYPMTITPYYFSLIDRNDPKCPVRLQCIPDLAELNFSSADMEDPLDEEKYSPLPGLIHRYPDRVLLMVTLECAGYCRHCTRKRMVVDTLKELMHLLVKNRVRPYYLYHCDYSRGVSHFRTTIRDGLDIQKGLIGFTSGFAIPQYVMDIPGGGGKVPLGPEYIKKYTDSEIVLRNFEGVDYVVNML